MTETPTTFAEGSSARVIRPRYLVTDRNPNGHFSGDGLEPGDVVTIVSGPDYDGDYFTKKSDDDGSRYYVHTSLLTPLPAPTHYSTAPGAEGPVVAELNTGCTALGPCYTVTTVHDGCRHYHIAGRSLTALSPETLAASTPAPEPVNDRAVEGATHRVIARRTHGFRVGDLVRLADNDGGRNWATRPGTHMFEGLNGEGVSLRQSCAEYEVEPLVDPEAPYVGKDGATHIVILAGPHGDFYHAWPVGARIKIQGPSSYDPGITKYHGPHSRGPFALRQGLQARHVRPITPADDEALVLAEAEEALRVARERVQDLRAAQARREAQERREAREAAAAEERARDEVLARRIKKAFYGRYYTDGRMDDRAVEPEWIAAAKAARRAVTAEIRAAESDEPHTTNTY